MSFDLNVEINNRVEFELDWVVDVGNTLSSILNYVGLIEVASGKEGVPGKMVFDENTDSRLFVRGVQASIYISGCRVEDKIVISFSPSSSRKPIEYVLVAAAAIEFAKTVGEDIFDEAAFWAPGLRKPPLEFLSYTSLKNSCTDLDKCCSDFYMNLYGVKKARS